MMVFKVKINILNFALIFLFQVVFNHLNKIKKSISSNQVNEKTSVYFTIACFLIEYGGANLSLKNNNNQTPLDLINTFNVHDDKESFSLSSNLLLRLIDHFHVNHQIIKSK